MAAAMASGLALAALLLIASCASTASAAQYTVGESSGWTTGRDYTAWAGNKKFKVGDSLVFKYFAPHTVDEVSAAGFASCSAASRLSAASGGTTTVALNAAGKRYFICGVPGDCRKGMKLVVHVAA